MFVGAFRLLVQNSFKFYHEKCQFYSICKLIHKLRFVFYQVFIMCTHCAKCSLLSNGLVLTTL